MTTLHEVDTDADAVAPPGEDTRLPPRRIAAVAPDEVVEAAPFVEATVHAVDTAPTDRRGRE